MELEVINKLYLELSQVATATTGKEKEIVEAAKRVVRARRCNADNGWDLLKNAIGELEDILERKYQ
jgi:hypothetical protein